MTLKNPYNNLIVGVDFQSVYGAICWICRAITETSEARMKEFAWLVQILKGNARGKLLLKLAWNGLWMAYFMMLYMLKEKKSVSYGSEILSCCVPEICPFGFVIYRVGSLSFDSSRASFRRPKMSSSRLSRALHLWLYIMNWLNKTKILLPYTIQHGFCTCITWLTPKERVFFCMYGWQKLY